MTDLKSIFTIETGTLTRLAEIQANLKSEFSQSKPAKVSILSSDCPVCGAACTGTCDHTCEDFCHSSSDENYSGIL